jgi:superfamily II DNA/RNA helicase
MDISRFSIDPALAAAAGADDSFKSAFYEKILSSLFENDENVYIKTDLSRDRNLVFIFPALYWLTSRAKPAEKARALYLCDDDETARALGEAAKALSSTVPGLTEPAVLLGNSASSLSAQAVNSAFVVASMEGLKTATADESARTQLSPRSFGLVIADQAEKIAERPGEEQRKTFGYLLPSWERKTMVVAAKASPKAKNFAWDFADNPKEIKLGESIGKAVTMPTQSFQASESEKIRFILKLLAEGKRTHICIFCNLKSSAAELSMRFTMNGVGSDYIAGNLNVERKKQIVAKALSHPEPFVLVLTDDGAKGIEKPGFSTLVNYDIPLEPEFYFDRISILDADNPESMLYNLVCERYMYGLPAIRRSLDASIDPRPLPGVEEFPKDASAGKRVELPDFRRDRDRDRDRERERERGPSRDSSRGPRSGGPRSGGPRSGGSRSAGDHPRGRQDEGKAAGVGTANPYSLSMEERMKLYRRKYGKKMDSPENSAGKTPSAKENE